MIESSSVSTKFASKTSRFKSRPQWIRSVRAAVIAFQKVIAKSAFLSQAYLAVVSALCRNVLSQNWVRHIEVMVVYSGVRWPSMTLNARAVIVGNCTKVMLMPHLGEFDQAILFSRRLDYEAGTFRWLEREATEYDAVIEIGANVGVYSVFLDALIKSSPGSRLRAAVCFEPSLEAFQRLIANLKVNDAVYVLPFRAAIADTTGFRHFFEPRGHLTNGSLSEEFARIFSNEIEREVVAAHSAAELEFFFRSYRKVLVKIDVEGYEPELLRTLGDIVMRYRPDLIIEVLSGTPERLSELPWLSLYERYLITSEGPQLHSEITANERHRDWLLKPATPPKTTYRDRGSDARVDQRLVGEREADQIRRERRSATAAVSPSRRPRSRLRSSARAPSADGLPDFQPRCFPDLTSSVPLNVHARRHLLRREA